MSAWERARFSFTASFAAALVCCAAQGIALADDAADIWARPQLHAADYVGSLSCAAASCHGAPQGRRSAGGITGQEYLRWLGEIPGGSTMRLISTASVGQKPLTTMDPHALTARRILEPRFQDVLRKASRKADGSADPKVYARCAACHDPQAVAAEEEVPPPGGAAASAELSLHPNEYSFGGIGCESCHGPAKRWLAAHYQQGISREDLTKLGMVDTKNVFVRARLCAACHVGSADANMNHDMLAAGHPPLRFEMASYQAVIDHKHWNDAPRRLAEPHYELQLWAAGRIAVADAGLALLEQRAREVADVQPKNDGLNATQNAESGFHRGAWPEFAEQSCFACHQPLRPAGKSTSLVAASSAGVPKWQTWNFLLVEPLLASKTAREGDLPAPANAFEQRLTALCEAMEGSAFPEPRQIADLAAAARESLHQQVQISVRGDVLGRGGQALGPRDLLRFVETRGAEKATPWERCCQELAAVLAVERSLRDDLMVEDERLSSTAKLAAVRQQARKVGLSLRFVSERYEWPLAFARLHPGGQGTENSLSLGEIAEQLREMWRELGEF